jgi:hypothetical protein
MEMCDNLAEHNPTLRLITGKIMVATLTYVVVYMSSDVEAFLVDLMNEGLDVLDKEDQAVMVSQLKGVAKLSMPDPEIDDNVQECGVDDGSDVGADPFVCTCEVCVAIVHYIQHPLDIDAARTVSETPFAKAAMNALRSAQRVAL